LPRLSTWFGASNVRERGKAKALPAKLAAGRPMSARL
jgi:hypothetical protein